MFETSVKQAENPVQQPEEVLSEAWSLAEDIERFGRKYLGHYMVDQETNDPVEPAAFHRELYQRLLVEMRLAVAAPREHAKSTVVDVIFVLYCLCYKLRKFIVVISDTEAQAILQITAVREEIENNAKLREDFGDLVGDKKWGDKDFRTSTDLQVSARGAGQSLRGLRYKNRRPDLVICDDLENDEAVDSPELRLKLKNWFKRAVLNLGKKCQVVVIGTILHFDSLLAEILDAEKFKLFVKLFYVAVDDDWTPESVLWPAKWSLADLRAKESDIGDVDFDQEFRNRPINAATAEFKEPWMKQHAFTWDEIRNVRFDKVIGIDPAISTAQRADEFGTVTIGIDHKGYIIVLRAEGLKIPFTEQVKHITERYVMEKPEAIGIEAVAYQRSLKQRMDEVSREKRLYMNVKEVEAKGDKFARIKTLAPLVENGTIRFNLDESQSKLRKQLLFLGKIKDDVADALEIAVRVAREMSLGISTEFLASSRSQTHAQMGAYAS